MCLTAEQAVQRAESLGQRFDVFGGAEPARDQIREEAVVFAHSLQEEGRLISLHDVGNKNRTYPCVEFKKHATHTSHVAVKAAARVSMKC